MKKMEEYAVQQFIGYDHGKKGYDVVALAQSMGLKKEEFENIQHRIPINEIEKKELENYFNKRGQ